MQPNNTEDPEDNDKKTTGFDLKFEIYIRGRGSRRKGWVPGYTGGYQGRQGGYPGRQGGSKGGYQWWVQGWIQRQVKGWVQGWVPVVGPGVGPEAGPGVGPGVGLGDLGKGEYNSWERGTAERGWGQKGWVLRACLGDGEDNCTRVSGRQGWVGPVDLHPNLQLTLTLTLQVGGEAVLDGLLEVLPVSHRARSVPASHRCCHLLCNLLH